ncbi:nuclear transport factor 2 family protein [Frankia sp. Cppng1_Ct_nod]|uniref:nuclear transport factor 2 family protein n=1 Tax=Frankia sp. Cppng1_Ct_nod TaxID=2897162 RepID=UPI0010413CA7|nr:nuclear transport factor 2 family protein [Frankia sp. Cppng1_Ct_nod]
MSVSGAPVSPAQVVRAYFEANAALDADAVGALYAPAGEMVVNGVLLRAGRQAITEHYRQWMTAFAPGDIATVLGSILVDGEHAAVQAEAVTRGESTWLGDFFVIRDGLIQRLATYVNVGSLDDALASGARKG